MSRLSDITGMPLQDALDLRTRQAQDLLDAVEHLLEIIPPEPHGAQVEAAIVAKEAATNPDRMK